MNLDILYGKSEISEERSEINQVLENFFTLQKIDDEEVKGVSIKFSQAIQFFEKKYSKNRKIYKLASDGFDNNVVVSLTV